MATDYVRGRDRLSHSSTKEKTSLSVANELLENRGNRWVKIDLAKAVRRLEPLLDFAVSNLLLNVEGQEVGRDVLIDLDTEHLSDSQTCGTTENEDHPFSCFLLPRLTRH